MARLEDQVTPAELLNIIRGGATKKEVCKQFRTSEQDLAVMLLPLYRSRDLTMEEFNDFFKGIALKPKEAPREGHPAPASPRPEDEPPSEILRSLSERALTKATEEKKTPDVVALDETREVAAAPETPRLPTPAPSATHTPEPESELEAEELLTEDEAVEDFVEEPDIEAEAIIQARRELEKAEPAPDVQRAAPTGKRVAAAPPRKVAEPVTPPVETDAMELRRALQLIIAKLSSIDEHLARMEKKL